MRHHFGGFAEDGWRARGQQQHLVGVLDDPLQPVLGHQHGGAEVVHQPLEDGQHLLGRARVERRGRLVQDQDARVHGEHRADRDALLLPAGEGAQRAVAQVGEAEQVEGLLHPAAHDVAGQSQRLHAVGEFVLHRVGDEVCQRVLPHGADQVGEFARPVLAGVPAADGDPAVQHPAGEVRHQAADRPQQGGLAGARRPHQQAEFTLGDGEVDPAQRGRGGLLVPDGDLLEGDHDALRGGVGAANAGTRPSSTVRTAASGSAGTVGGTTVGAKAAGSCAAR